MTGQHAIYARIMLNVVVLPAPFGPKRARIVSCETPKETSSTAFVREPRNVLETCNTRNESLDFETASTSAPTSISKLLLLFASVLRLLRLENIFAGRFDPESNQTRMEKRVRARVIRYAIGPPYLIKLPIEFVVIRSLPSQRSENRLIEMNDARS